MDYPLEHAVDDSTKICVRSIKAGSLFVVVAASICSVFVPLFALVGILAAFGFETVHVNSHPVFGAAGFFTALIMAPVFSLILSIFVWGVLYIGIHIWGSFRPFTISYVSARKTKG